MLATGFVIVSFKNIVYDFFLVKRIFQSQFQKAYSFFKTFSIDFPIHKSSLVGFSESISVNVDG